MAKNFDHSTNPTVVSIAQPPPYSRLHRLPICVPQAIDTLLCLDFAGPVTADAELGERLSADAAVAGDLGLLPGASSPIVLRGDPLKAWLAQPDDGRVAE